ncbi:outer membrane beta-barrel protein [Bacteroides gallinaceum]|uniref:outer membrane beta-barrel protein n=1 Tax=Bacteroides gallinaceum TaxID=1462571 RepID=UPI0015AB8736|nr:outer membrane beta-barrel protein [Bacteroides gallinaceum]MDM8155336.1 outer membrane beta-barrel protein [Bacteroides gallinaceum]
MKKFKLFVLAAFLGLATSASAQFVNSGSSNSSASSTSSSFDFTSVKTNGWSRIYVSYLPSKMKLDYDDADDMKFKGFQVGWLKGFGLTQRLPLYMEAGAAIQYRSYKDEESDSYYDFSQKCNLLSLNIPVNLLYRFNIKDDFSISPYFGLDFRINLLGKIKYEETYDGDTDSWDGNLFDDDDMDNEAWKRFQAGWHIGVGFDYRIIHIAIEYGTDFNEIAEKSKFATTAITLGLNF